MNKRFFFCCILIFLIGIPGFSQTTFTVNKTCSIKQIEPKEKKAEILKKQIKYFTDKDYLIKHEIIDEDDFFSNFTISKDINKFSLAYVTDTTTNNLYTITFIQNNTIKINNTDTYIFKEDSYLNFYNDLSSSKSIFAFFNFLVFSHYFFLDDSLQELPIFFYNYKYEILEGCFLVQSPDSYLRLPHSVVYKYDQYGNLIIESKCSDENFTGLNFCNVYKLKGNFISTGKIQIKYFEKQSKKYDLNFNYETNTITVLGESIHSYFTDKINYIYETL